MKKTQSDIFDFFIEWEKHRFPECVRRDLRGDDFLAAVISAKESHINALALIEQFCNDYEDYLKLKSISAKINTTGTQIKSAE